MSKSKKRDWEETEYTHHIRIKKSKHALINEKKGKKSMSGKLDEIIDYWDKNIEYESNME